MRINETTTIQGGGRPTPLSPACLSQNIPGRAKPPAEPAPVKAPVQTTRDDSFLGFPIRAIRVIRGFLLVLSLALSALPSLAGSRTGDVYTVSADTADYGGLRATSAVYRIDGSIGAVAGASTNAPSPLYLLKSAYVGQLTDVTNLTVTATLPTILEGETNQLAGLALLDDETMTVLAATNLTWDAPVAPVLSITSNGLAAIGYVDTDTSATVTATYVEISGFGIFTVRDKEGCSPTVFMFW